MCLEAHHGTLELTMAQWRLTWCSGAHRGSMEAHGGAVEAHGGTVEVHHGAWKFTMAHGSSPWRHGLTMAAITIDSKPLSQKIKQI